MLKASISVFLVFMSSYAFSYERLSFYKLIISPQHYNEDKIYLSGYFVKDGSNCLIISNDKETALIYREYEMVKLCKESAIDTVNSDLFEKLSNKYGAVAGSFSTKKCGELLKLGHSLNYLGCFTSIDELYGPIYENGPIMPPPPIN